ncbi:unnamed protein product [Candidula unifasciata]|uniref:Amine oxidase n=1 Tax=Candidula unifasciata TaxID=100452 RepID=A0A8S3ZXF6_9EUPU|nr:unnamed protein product [Candidula unifasciata]
MKRVRKFLEADIGVVKPEVANLTDPHIFTMDLELPKKADVLAYLDHNASAPHRKARIIVFRGDLEPPVVEERLCGPLDNIISCPVDVTVPFSQRPVENREYEIYERSIMKKIHATFEHWSSSYRKGRDRMRNSEGKTNCDYLLLVKLKNKGAFIDSFILMCAGALYNDIQEFLTLYNNGTIKKTQMKYPTKQEALFSTLKQRGSPKPPDGKRYTIRHRKVEYLDMWSFNFRMSTIFGPGIYDVRFLGERIAYEINLGEIVVFYSGYNPMQRQAFYVDSFVLTGSQSQALVAGADCPTTATFLPLTVTSQGREEPAVFPRAICIFEQNLGTPIRRHHSYDRDSGVDYGGMLDSALIVRSIHTIDNYDYIVDFTFHQNGALGVSIGQSGFLFTSFYTPEERPYGVKITDHITGALHVHLANFKVDLDINGTSNRYESIDIEEETVDLRQAKKSQAKYSQTRFSYNIKETERKAALKNTFNTPMYHIFHNNDARNKFGEKKAYRLASNGMVKQLLQKNVGNEGSQAWARYQLAVTKHKDEERTTGNPYGQWVSDQKVVDFEKFIDDDENIVDEDLVAWVTVGFHHIPHAEDLPVTTTSGKHQSFYLFPYNYFEECPSMKSRDAIYVSHKDSKRPEKGLHFEYYGTGDVKKYNNKGVCRYQPLDIAEFWMKNPDDLVELTKHNGVI